MKKYFYSFGEQLFKKYFQKNLSNIRFTLTNGSISSVSTVTSTEERSINVGAGCICVTVVNRKRTFINVLKHETNIFAGISKIFSGTSFFHGIY